MSNATANLAALLPSAGGQFVVEERPIPSPGPEDILLRNHAAALNPIDWKRQAFGIAIPTYPSIFGSDAAGVVAAVGSAVTSFKPGDRVIASADGMGTGNIDRAAFQTYTVVSASAAAKLPDTLTFNEGATLPTALGTAAIALFDVLGLPTASITANKGPSTAKQGILVWGGASSTGSATVQLARLAGLTVFATASPQHHERVRALGATAVVDYRSPTVVDELVAAARQAGVDITLAADALTKAETVSPVVDVLSRFEGPKKVATLGLWPEQVARPEGVEAASVRGLKIWEERRDLSVLLFNEHLGAWLEKGEVVPGTVRVVDGGLGGLQGALDELKKGGVSGEKLVVEI
ncbi:chaperonin 10-like protein [Parachaetomium inaequale]|uniref:Chaperonin 10-like protein n=1 Tax=Parachaetomium inaequale TaxID=2588326 RepID=A0AAN6P8Z0_9PEZI|nr:chaperonin 10-like protein [Parachaetomium inaequale]